MTSVSARSTPSRPTVAPAWTLEFATRNGRRRVVPAVRDASQRSTTQRVGNVEQPPQVINCGVLSIQCSSKFILVAQRRDRAVHEPTVLAVLPAASILFRVKHDPRGEGAVEPWDSHVGNGDYRGITRPLDGHDNR